MQPKRQGTEAREALSDEDRLRIAEDFALEVIPKLLFLQARVGTVNCGFAGERYRNWQLVFRATGGTFRIEDYLYDPDGEGISLDP